MLSLWHFGEPEVPFDFWRLNHSIIECFRLLRMNHIIPFRRQNLWLASKAWWKSLAGIWFVFSSDLVASRTLLIHLVSVSVERNKEGRGARRPLGSVGMYGCVSVRDFEENLLCWIADLSFSSWLIPLSLCTYAEISKLWSAKSEAFSNNLPWHPLFP